MTIKKHSVGTFVRRGTGEPPREAVIFEHYFPDGMDGLRFRGSIEVQRADEYEKIADISLRLVLCPFCSTMVHTRNGYCAKCRRAIRTSDGKDDGAN